MSEKVFPSFLLHMTTIKPTVVSCVDLVTPSTVLYKTWWSASSYSSKWGGRLRAGFPGLTKADVEALLLDSTLPYDVILSLNMAESDLNTIHGFSSGLRSHESTL